MTDSRALRECLSHQGHGVCGYGVQVSGAVLYMQTLRFIPKPSTARYVGVPDAHRPAFIGAAQTTACQPRVKLPVFVGRFFPPLFLPEFGWYEKADRRVSGFGHRLFGRAEQSSSRGCKEAIHPRRVEMGL